MARDREKRNAWYRKRYATDEVYREQRKLTDRLRYQRLKEHRAEQQLQRRYGITSQEREEMQRRQGDCCAICGGCFERLLVDHCHDTGVVRGLLCDRCNRALGYFQDREDVIRRAADYLAWGGVAEQLLPPRRTS